MVGSVVLNCTLYLFLSLLHELNIRKIVDPVVSFQDQMFSSKQGLSACKRISHESNSSNFLCD